MRGEVYEGPVIHDIWLLRLRALLARAHGDHTAYRDYRDRYRDMANAWLRGTYRVGRGNAMTAVALHSSIPGVGHHRGASGPS
jgi:hypothetical protein